MSTEKQTDAKISRRDFVKTGASVGLGATALAGLVNSEAEAQGSIQDWDLTADFVVVGAGTAGLAGAVSALDHGASVIMVEENYDIGGHGIVSGGNVNLGGGTTRQRKYGVEDSADQVFEDWTNHEQLQSRYSDREMVRTFADENAATFEWLVENGVDFQDHVLGGGNMPQRQGRSNQWPIYEELITSHPSRVGSGVVRALERSARNKGAEILLLHKMTSLVREAPTSGRVLGIVVVHEGAEVRIRGTRGVLLATGGHTSNVLFRRIFDPRLTEEYQVAGEPYSKQTADGELAAMAVGASLWSTANQTVEAGNWISKAAHIGTPWGYGNLVWLPDSPMFDQTPGSGLSAVDWQNAIMVTEMGRRFHNEIGGGHDFYNAALAYHGNPNKLDGGGPIWAIFDAEAVARQRWDPTPPYIKPDSDWFFNADTIAGLASRIRNPHQKIPTPPAVLEETVARYNSFVDSGTDEDFGKPTPRNKIQTPPFYAAWSTPILHDSLTGLRTNTRAQVMDLQGGVISGLYCAGETQGGFAQHGLGRCLVFGRVAGRDAALNGGEV